MRHWSRFFPGPSLSISPLLALPLQTRPHMRRDYRYTVCAHWVIVLHLCLEGCSQRCVSLIFSIPSLLLSLPLLSPPPLPPPPQQLLCQVPLGDPQAPAMLAQTGFPTPWQTLRTALQWSVILSVSLLTTKTTSHRNQGFLSDKLTLDLLPLNRKDHTHSTEVPPSHQFECVLRCGEEGEEGEEVRVTCAGRKDGQVAAAQAMLKVHAALTVVL